MGRPQQCYSAQARQTSSPSSAPLIPRLGCTGGFLPVPSCRPLKPPLQEPHPHTAQAEGSTLPAQPLLSRALDQRGPRNMGGTSGFSSNLSPPHTNRTTVSHEAAGLLRHNPPTAYAPNVTLRHFSNIPHPLTHPRLLHAEKSHLHQRATQGEGSQGIFVCTDLGKYSRTKSLSKAALLHKHKKYNPCLVKKQLPVFTLPAQKHHEPHAVQPCTFWQC